MTSWRRAQPATYPRPALSNSAPSIPAVEGEAPWVPDDPDGTALERRLNGANLPGGQRSRRTAEPVAAATPAPPAAVPVVISEWELIEDADGAVDTKPRLLAVPRAAVTVKDDDPPGRERVRRFVEAWRWLIAARAQIKSAGLSAEESDRYLAGAGVLVRVVPPGARRRRRR
jgi:hypothetical protein